MNNLFNPIIGAFVKAKLDNYPSMMGRANEIEDILRLRSARNRAFIGAKLVAMQAKRRVNQHTMNAAIEKVSSFMDAMAMDFVNDNQMVKFNDFMNECVSVTFRKRTDVKININLIDNPEDRSEEALVVYVKDGRTYMQNDTLHNAVMIVKQLLEL